MLVYQTVTTIDTYIKLWNGSTEKTIGKHKDSKSIAMHCLMESVPETESLLSSASLQGNRHWVSLRQLSTWTFKPVSNLFPLGILIGGSSPPEKYESQIGSSSQLLGKINKIMFQTTNQWYYGTITIFHR